MDMSGVLTPRPILAQTIHPCLPQRRYSKVYLVIRKCSALDMKLAMDGIFCRFNLLLALVPYLESKSSNASSISDTSATVGYVTTCTRQPLSYNCSDWTSISFFGLDKIVSKASREVFIAFIFMIRS